jgi:hypothetical protein
VAPCRVGRLGYWHWACQSSLLRIYETFDPKALGVTRPAGQVKRSILSRFRG